ncbi:Surface antigen [bacterium A37T11]|nr:Surface antigen [bacterium A37T11]
MRKELLLGYIRQILLVVFGIVKGVCCFGQQPPNEIVKSRIHADTSKQRDLIDLGKKLFHISPPKDRDSTGEKVYFSILPFSTSVPGGGNALITSTTAGFYLGDRKTTFMSKATFTPYFNFSGRFGLPITSYLWLKNNQWVIKGDTRILKYPQNTWGLGRQYGNGEEIKVNYTYIRFYQQLLRRIKDGMFAGIGYNLDDRMKINTDEDKMPLAEYSKYKYGTEAGGNSISSGISLNLLYDTRANSINPLDGYYTNLQYRINSKALGSDQNWQSLYVDVRRYFRYTDNPNKQNMLAVWTYFWTVLNRNVPYLDLPSVGWDPDTRSGRGQDQNRYRGRHLAYVEAEYRRDLTSNGLFGFVVFANANTVSGPKSTFFWSWNPAIGTGLRIKFNKNSGTNFAVDYGISKGYSGFQLSLGEVF